MPKPPYRRRVEAPPSTITGELYRYLDALAFAVNSIPQFSYFSAATPNSMHTGMTGDVAINLASGSTDTRVWLLGGNSLSQLTTLGWVTLRTNT